jgi:putative membrane protein
MLIFLIFGLLLGAVAVVFAFQNVAVVTVMFLGWQFEGSLALIILLSVAAGVAISLLVSFPGMVKKSFQISGLRKHSRHLEEKLTHKEAEVEMEKSKLATNNAYLDDLEKRP